MATTTTLSILDVAHFLFGSVDQQITFLQQKGLLATNKTCGTCHASMTLGSKRDISDGSIFRCRNCKTTKSLRVGSFFSKSKLPPQKWLVLLYWWIRQYPVGDAAEEARVSRETAINVYQWLRQYQVACNTNCAGRTVQIDESLFRHKPNVSLTVVKNSHN